MPQSFGILIMACHRECFCEAIYTVPGLGLHAPPRQGVKNAPACVRVNSGKASSWRAYGFFPIKRNGTHNDN